MLDFSLIIPDSHDRVASSFVASEMQLQRERSFTGLMQLRYPSGEHLVFTFLEGVPQKLYRSREQSIEIIPQQSWSGFLELANASIGYMTLPLDGLRLVRVAHEAPIAQIERNKLSAQDLGISAERWAAETTPSIVHLLGNPVNKLYLISGYSTPILEELTFFGNQARFSVSDASFAQSLPAGDYQVVRYVSNNNYEIWQEYELRFAIHPLMRMLLIRFSELAGRTLTERLCEQLSAWMKANGLNIGITMNGVTHHHDFESLNSAGRAYQQMVQKFNQAAGPAIGVHMANGLVQQALPKLNSHHRMLIQRHVYDPENAAGKPGGNSV